MLNLLTVVSFGFVDIVDFQLPLTPLCPKMVPG